MILEWDKIGERLGETGADHCVLYKQSGKTETNDYDTGYAWNGITAVTEKPSGAEASPQYADNIKYLNLVSAEDFAATLEAFMYPSEFEECDGSAEIAPGVSIGQQARKQFGLSYRTLIVNDTEGQSYGYKLHLVYNALAAPSEKPYNTINDSPEITGLSWELSTTPVPVTAINPKTGKPYKPTASMTINSVTADPEKLKQLEAILYGSADADPRLPWPDEVFALFNPDEAAA